MSDDAGTGDLGPRQREIMEATYRAVSEHGYGDLTIQHIADEFDRSKTLIYYHYDGRDDLLVDFLEYVLDEFLSALPTRETDSPREELVDLVDRLLPTTVDEGSYRVMLAMFELRVNAPHDEDSRVQYRVVEEELRTLLADILQRGIDAGQFRHLDENVEAEALLSLLIGVRARRLTVYSLDESIEPLKRAIAAHIDRVTVDDAPPVELR